MSQQARNTLKGYFQTGKVPSQANFGDFIDSGINKSSDQVYVDSSQNVGLGFNLPPARLAVTNSGTQILSGITVSLTSGNATASAQLLPGMQLVSMIYPGDVIQVSGVQQLFSVVSVATDSLQLSPTPDLTAPITDVSVSLFKNLVYIGLPSQTGTNPPQLVMTNQGNVGLGVTLPNEVLEVNGNVLAGKFMGNGSMLTHLNATNITGQFTAANLPTITFGDLHGKVTLYQLPNIPVTNLTGILAVAQIPDIPASMITGVLSPSQLPAIPNTAAVAIGVSNPIVTTIGVITVNITVPANTTFTLTYVSGGAVVNLNNVSNSGSFTPTATGFRAQITITQSTLITLTATLTGGTVQQANANVQLELSPAAYMIQLQATGTSAQQAVTTVATQFGMQALSNTNIYALAQSMFVAKYTSLDITTSISAYYTHLGYLFLQKDYFTFLSEVVKILNQSNNNNNNNNNNNP
ncbi:hypothetical protein [Flavobacterium sp. UGB4466]|uniref:hypothetical protein n=1 Tax=Flavobacterium sp. UGB4466 TaxID=2730889 RepID=UPI00192B4C66|nr:hypothetical protein [Flavobacterium sp. UGB4466]